MKTHILAATLSALFTSAVLGAENDGVVVGNPIGNGNGNGNATGAPLPGLNMTGLSTEGVTTVVTIVDRFLTYVAEPTVFTFGENGVYSVREAGTVAVTDCPCTITTTRCLGPDCYYKGPTIVPNSLPPRPDGSSSVLKIPDDVLEPTQTKAAVAPVATGPGKAVVVSGGERVRAMARDLVGILGVVAFVLVL